MDPESIFQLLSKEYFALLAIVESYNDQSLVIKGWSVTVGIAALITVYSRPLVETAGRAGVFIAAFAVLPFYLTDALWKTFQIAYVVRLESIEEFFRVSDAEPPIVLQGWTDWETAYSSSGILDYLGSLFLASVYLPHLFVLAGGLVLAIFFPPRNNAVIE